MIQTCTYLFSSNWSPQRRRILVISKFFSTGNRFHIELRIFAPETLFKGWHLGSLQQN